MRILFANTLYPSQLHPEIRGGAETFSKRLCEALVTGGHSVRVVRCGPVRGVWDPEQMNGVEIITLPVRNIYSPWLNRAENPLARAIWHLVDDLTPPPSGFDAILDEFRPDVFHSNVLPGLTVGLWPKVKARGIPIVHTLHDYYLTCARSLRFSGGARCIKTCTSCSMLTRNRRRASSLIDTVVSVSDRTLEVHRENGVFEKNVKSVVIRNPAPSVETKIVAVDATDRPLVFGFLGRSCIEKGSFELAAAFKDMPADRARLVIAGHVDESTKALIVGGVGAAEVAFLGFVQPEAFFRQIDVMILPSLWEEPSPMTIGESFAYAKPVIGSRRGGIPELLHDSRSGWLFEPGGGRLRDLVAAIVADKSSVIVKSRFLINEGEGRKFEDLVLEYLAVYNDALRPSGKNSS